MAFLNKLILLLTSYKYLKKTDANYLTKHLSFKNDLFLQPYKNVDDIEIRSLMKMKFHNIN